MEGAEAAPVFTHIGVIEMMIGDEKGFVAVPDAFNGGCKLPQTDEIRCVETGEAVFRLQAFMLDELPAHRPDGWVGNAVKDNVG